MGLVFLTRLYTIIIRTVRNPEPLVVRMGLSANQQLIRIICAAYTAFTVCLFSSLNLEFFGSIFLAPTFRPL